MKKTRANTRPLRPLNRTRNVMRQTLLYSLVILCISFAVFVARPAFADVEQFAFASSPQTIAAGVVSEPITLQAQDGSGMESKVPSTACVSLSSSSVGEFSSSAAGWSPIAVLTIAKNTANRNFYYKGTTERVHIVSARVALKPETESRSCANWPVSEWPSGWNATHSITIGTPPAASPNTANTPGASGQAAVSSPPPSSSSGSSQVETPAISVSAAVPQRGTAGASVFFDAVAVGLKKEPLQNARYVWSFGDGGTAEGKKVSHVYHYPAAYVVMVTAASGEWSATDRKEITIAAPELVFSNLKEGADGFIELRNAGQSDTDLSFWILKSGTHTFTIPQGTVIGGGKTIPFPAAITGLSADSLSTALFYPNGNLVTAYAAPSPAPAPLPAKAETREAPPAVQEAARSQREPERTSKQAEETTADPTRATVPAASSTILIGAAGAATVPGATPWVLGTAILVILSVGGYILLSRTDSRPTEAERLQKEAAEYDIIE